MTLRGDIESITIRYKDGAEIDYEGDDIRVNDVQTEIPGDKDSDTITVPARYLNILIHLVP